MQLDSCGQVPCTGQIMSWKGFNYQFLHMSIVFLHMFFDVFTNDLSLFVILCHLGRTLYTDSRQLAKLSEELKQLK